ncbi:MAG: uracil-DNA glycosylase [Chloroflexi bacterium]|nr:uracil-DNA glycosylase [Chloroflexota bacterium]MCI0783657.1 uracil-DNA glycosylase [Chloroflexota bacterium]MCI0814338.1 uracil-DNA glycosylase [Chloroflexota bacterium]MCI0817704.1 uracil-DNA glycosylase [Chloroflexota bacterium]MCI0820470.1 uracil-DNA glycosylase [Chloroflexota bacterium]
MVTELEALYTKIITCESCNLCKTRTHAVPGEGAEDAEIMFVGEGPGYHEDQQGRPFIGPAGKFLDELLDSINLTRSDVYICNVVKCRPPSNRDPIPEEVDACRPFLLRQIELINPKLIVTLGRFSLSWFFPRDAIGKVRGTLRQLGGRHYYHVYHPAAALHNGNLRQVILDDFAKIPLALEKLREDAPLVAAATVPDSVEQGRLF